MLPRRALLGSVLLLVSGAACGKSPAVAPPAGRHAKAARPPAVAPASTPSVEPAAAVEPAEPPCVVPPECKDACSAPRQLALGSGHGCILEASGALACWGDNDAG